MLCFWLYYKSTQSGDYSVVRKLTNQSYINRSRHISLLSTTEHRQSPFASLIDSHASRCERLIRVKTRDLPSLRSRCEHASGQTDIRASHDGRPRLERKWLYTWAGRESRWPAKERTPLLLARAAEQGQMLSRAVRVAKFKSGGTWNHGRG